MSTTVQDPRATQGQPLSAIDTQHLRQAFVWAHAARTRGNRPFGTVVVAQDGRILAEAFSNSRETGDCTGHAEMNAIRQLGNPPVAPEVLAQATLYASAQPCAMCACAICHAGIGRVVYGLDDERLLQLHPHLRGNTLDCRTVFDSATYAVRCIGPALVAEALAVYENSWLPPLA
jgi:tRNA(Arg) A34 adenosine deaminase TadA